MGRPLGKLPLLKRANDGRGLSNIGTEYIDRFACVLLNGRQVSRLCERADLWHTSGGFQIKNSIAIVTALAAAKGDMCSSSHTSQALAANGNFIPASSDTSGDNSLGYGPKNHRHSGYFRLGNFLLGTQKMWKLWKLHAD
jgi:hypothetical protein